MLNRYNYAWVSKGIGELKVKIFELLREDLEFRYAAAGLLGLEEILRRFDRHEPS